MPEDAKLASFVRSNVLSIFYHELGHAVIDVLQLPVLGREEDAADTLAALLVHQMWDEETATQIVYDTAEAYVLYDAEAEKLGYPLAYADTHSLDLQRYYNLVCLFYGANPEMRADEAEDLSLPEDRAVTCPEEFELAEASWSGLLAGLAPEAGAKGLRLVGVGSDDPVAKLLADEIALLNEAYGLPEWIDVTVEPCGEANAFYYPDEKKITICSEYAPDLVRLWQASP
ncbi:MAG: DUF4344 domain-containing metallopeptidase [Paracoccaceae bacterium]